MQVTEEMLAAAMKKAVESGVLPKHVDETTYLKNWAGMKQALQAALDAAGLVVPELPEFESAGDIDYLKGAPEDWDADYRSIWEKLQVESRNKMQWRAHAMQLRTVIATANG